jgi:hypothetical protein
MFARPVLILLIVCGAVSLSAQEHYRIVFLNTNPYREELPKAAVDSLQKGHMANIDSLWRTGDLLAAGPFDGGGGIFIFPDFAEEHVSEILKSDPAISAHRFNIESYRITVPTGAICPVEEGYQMRYYSFIRYESTLPYQLEPDYEMIKDHLIYLEGRPDTLTLNFHAWIDGQPGCGFMEIGNEMSRTMSDWLDGSPLFATGSISYTYRKIWMAEGVFCE